ncbi:hypothetical protein Tco_0190357 [Tanacetum coccineum]
MLSFLSQTSYLVASSTHDSARTYVMQGAPFTQGTIPRVPVGPVFLLGLLALAIDAACAFRAEEMPSFEEEDGEWICFLGGNSFSGTKKYRGSNSSDGGNTGDGVKIAGGVIGSGDEIGEITDGIILEFSEELKEMLPDEAGK